MRASLEVADIFRSAGPDYRAAHAGHLSLGQLKVMTAIENCRTAALGGHVEACDDCGHWRIAYNSCRNRHCPKCQGAAARTWLAAREADLLPVGYFHVVFTLPAQVADIALQNKAVVYDLLFRAAADTMLIIAADPKHLGARVGITAVLHTWGSALTHHPHVHMIVPGGGIALDGTSRGALLFHLLSKLCEHTSADITTNLTFSEWAEVLGDAKMTTALLDRLAHHRHILETGNDSFRFRASAATPKPRKEKSHLLTHPRNAGHHLHQVDFSMKIPGQLSAEINIPNPINGSKPLTKSSLRSSDSAKKQ